MRFSRESTPLAVENESGGVLLRYGLPTCAATILLAYLGNDVMRLGVLAGAAVAYGIVWKRKVYPFGRIISAGQEISPGDKTAESLSSALESHKRSIHGVALAWFGVLLIICAVGLLAPVIHISLFTGPDVIDRLTNISVVAALAASRLAQSHKAAVAQHVATALRILDHIILLSLSLFVSITGSSCLYWLAVRRKDRKEREAAA